MNITAGNKYHCTFRLVLIRGVLFLDTGLSQDFVGCGRSARRLLKATHSFFKSTSEKLCISNVPQAEDNDQRNIRTSNQPLSKAVKKFYRIVLYQYYQPHGGCENPLHSNNTDTAKSWILKEALLQIQIFNIRTIQYWAARQNLEKEAIFPTSVLPITGHEGPEGE